MSDEPSPSYISAAPPRPGGAALTWTLALAGSLCLHLGVVELAPNWSQSTHLLSSPESVSEDQNHSTEIELTFEPPATDPVPPPKADKPETPPNFGQANPDLPAEEPDRADFFGASNQRQAQMSPKLPEPETVSKIEGELEESTAVKTGQSSTQALPEMVAGAFALGGENRPGENQPQKASAPPPPPPQPSFYEARPDQQVTPDGLASRLSQADKGAKDGEGKKPSDSNQTIALNLPEGEKREGEAEGGTGPSATGEQKGVPVPRPRPRLSPEVMSTILMKRPGNAQQAVGQALNINFSPYGEYLQKMFESIEARWHELNRQVPSISGEVGTDTLIIFKINKLGEVVSCEIRRSTCSKVTQSVCLDAIKSRAPFGVWTEEMTRVLNEEEEIRLHFIYR